MNPRIITTLVLAGAIGLVLTLPADSGAGRKELEIRRKGVSTAPSKRNEQKPVVRGAVVHLQGEISGGRQGFRLDGRPLYFDARTTFYPGVSDRTRALDPASLTGRTATVYGWESSRGVEVSLVILTGEGPLSEKSLGVDPRTEPGVPDPSTHRVPSEVDSNVGVLTENAPG